MLFRHADFQFELPDEWWREADVATFRPSRSSYRVSRLGLPAAAEVFVIPINDVTPTLDRQLKSPGHGVFASKERTLDILSKLKADVALFPIEIDYVRGSRPFRLKHGAHRLYCSLALGYSHIPAVDSYFTGALLKADIERQHLGVHAEAGEQLTRPQR